MVPDQLHPGNWVSDLLSPPIDLIQEIGCLTFCLTFCPLDLETDQWAETVRGYGRMFHRVAGKAETLRLKALAIGRKWLAGMRAGRRVFRPSRTAS